MNASLIAIGIMLLIFAFVIYPIQVPWVEWTGGLFPIPQYRPFSLAPASYIFGTMGVISIVFGLTKNEIIRVLLTFIVAIACIGFLTGYITPEKLTQWIGV